MSDDHMDLDAMLDNPFRSFRSRSAWTGRPDAVQPDADAGAIQGEVLPGRREMPLVIPEERIPVSQPETAEPRIERNHPMDLRVLSLEKDELITAKKLDDIRRIIEHQNERIRLIEEELDVLRKALEKRGE